MITRAQDYQTITPIGLIDGGILPARDVAGDGTWRILRAEDLCFAIEAVNERRGLFGLGNIANEPNLPVTPSFALQREGWERLARHLVTLMDRRPDGEDSFAVYQGASFAPIAYTTTPPGTSAAAVWSAAKVVERPSTNAWGPVLDAAAVRSWFYSLQFADRFCLNPSVTPFTGTATYADAIGTAYTTTSCANGYFDAADERVLGYGYDEDYAYIRKIWGIKSATLSCTVPMLELVTDACIVALYELTGFDDSMSGTWYFSRTIPLTVPSSGVVSIPSAAWLSDFEILDEATSLGFNFPERPQSAISWINRVVVNTVLARLVVNYNFRTEIRSLNWRWTP